MDLRRLSHVPEAGFYAAHYAYQYPIFGGSGPSSLFVITRPDSIVYFASKAPSWGLLRYDQYIYNRYREELTFSQNGYTSYYLENENFEVPAGCTAYIVTGVTPVREGEGTAVLKAFGPGTLIPRQTGFILQGTPGAKQLYQAYISGTEADVSGNLLVGTAQESEEFNAPGYKYFVFGKGMHGMGFYKQGTRDGASIRLTAHKAGLRLPDSLAPVKSLRFDFQSAKEQLLTGISAALKAQASQAQTETSTASGTYDLQGRRLPQGQWPKPGLYLVNGRKTLIRK